jgi:hypothetical protein
MRRAREHEDGGETPGGRWQRRALRHAAERRRIPKHGKTYVGLVEQMLAERARAAAALASPAAGKRPKRRRARPAEG